MKYNIQYSNLINWKAIKRLPKKEAKHISEMIVAKLESKPEVYGKPLRRTLKGYRSLRIGDYRVIFRVNKITVSILSIDHRSVVYNNFDRKIRDMKKKVL